MDPARGRAASARRPIGRDGAEKPPGRTLISPSETKRFAARGISHWNPYGRRINHFAVLFVFNGLTPVSFRRFRGFVRFQWLNPFFGFAALA
jgi:hypothetical protein